MDRIAWPEHFSWKATRRGMGYRNIHTLQSPRVYTINYKHRNEKEILLKIPLPIRRERCANWRPPRVANRDGERSSIDKRWTWPQYSYFLSGMIGLTCCMPTINIRRNTVIAPLAKINHKNGWRKREAYSRSGFHVPAHSSAMFAQC